MFFKLIKIINITLLLQIFIITKSFSIEKLEAHGGPVKGLGISSDKTMLASASFDYSAVVWSLNPVKELVTLIGHDAAVNTAKFTNDNKFLVTGGDDNQILVWNLKKAITSGGEILPIKLSGHKGKIVDLKFSIKNNLLFSASWDGKIGIWNLNTKKNIGFLEGHKGPVYSIELSNEKDVI